MGLGLLKALGLAPKKVAVTAGGAPPVAPVAGPAGAAAGPAAKPVDKAKADYESKRDAARKLLDALKLHPQHAHVAAEIATATGHLGTAKAHADKAEYPKALAAVEKARGACVAGKGFADKFAAYLAKRGEAMAVLHAVQVGGWDSELTQDAPVLAADALAAAPTRNYSGATAAVKKVLDGLAVTFKRWYVDEVKPKIAKLKKHKAAAFVDRDIKRIETLHAEVVASIAAKAWRKANLTGNQVDSLLFDAERIANRRDDFDLERKAAVKAIDGLKAHKSLAGQMGLLNQRLAAADAQASRETMHIEDALNALKQIAATCSARLKLGEGAAAYANERKPADAGVAALQAHVAAAKLKPEIEALRKQLDSAAKLAGDVDGNRGVIHADPAAQDFTAARALIKQVLADLAAAKTLAAGLDGVAAADQALAGTPDDKAVKQAIADLRKELASARKQPHAAMAKAQLDAVEAGLKDAEAKLAGKDGAKTAAPLVTAAGARLVEARKVQIEHSRFVDQHKAVEARRQLLLKSPLAPKLTARIEAVTKALAEATQQDQAKAWPQATAALRQAEAAATAAEQAVTARKAFDGRVAKLKALVDKTVYSSNAGKQAQRKAEQQAALAGATGKADGFDFAAAQKALDAIETRIESAEAEKLTGAAHPDEAKLKALAKKMMARGGEKELEALIQRTPSTANVKAFTALAEARFGIHFEAEEDGNEQESMKRMCVLMSQVKKDVIKNPSLKRINRRVTNTDGSGASQDFPFYDNQRDEVVMNSRPKEYTKPDFDAGAAGILPNREEACKPANNTPEDLFDFNMLHELAHAIDDAKNFMASKGRGAEFGGWIEHGGNLEAIADAVAEWSKFNSTAVERKYVLDVVMENIPVVPPRPAVDGDKWDARKKKVDDWFVGATTDNVWENQALCTKITVKAKEERIYHKAYAPNTWVSYLASARARGITGYQFRAPGEWFSELYAAWKSKKLKPSHPAVGWLSKLSG